MMVANDLAPIVTRKQTTHGDSTSGNSGFFTGKSDGWFWYQEELEEEIEEELEPEILPPPSPAPEPPTKEIATPKGPAPFSAEWVRVNLPKYRDIAWSDPTEENMRVYLYLQQFAIDRSEKFAEVSGLVTHGDPYLDSVTRRATSAYASNKLDAQAGIAVDKLLNVISQKAGIFFFYDSQSEISIAQASIINMLERAHNTTVMAISIDGHPLPGGLFPDYRVDQGQSAKMNVMSTPAIYLVQPNGNFSAISQGALSLSELKDRIISVAYKENIISREEYNEAIPALNRDLNTDELLKQRLAKNEKNNIEMVQNGENDNFMPPAEILEYFSGR